MNSSSIRALTISDTHYEMQPIHRLLPHYPAHDVVLLAGDIDAPLHSTVEWLAKGDYLGDKPVVMAAGNHDFYGRVLQDEMALAKQAAEGTRVHLLDCDAVVIDGVRYLGCTLWTDFALHGNVIAGMRDAQFGMADFNAGNIGYRVPGFRNPQKFRAEHSLQEHRRHLAWLTSELAQDFDGPSVVLTHHGISHQSVPSEYKDDRLSPSFSSPLEALVLRTQPTLWIHGHTHSSLDYTIGDTRVVCNPKGYGPSTGGGHAENRSFIEDLVIEIPLPSPTPRMK